MRERGNKDSGRQGDTDRHLIKRKNKKMKEGIQTEEKRSKNNQKEKGKPKKETQREGERLRQEGEKEIGKEKDTGKDQDRGKGNRQKLVKPKAAKTCHTWNAMLRVGLLVKQLQGCL